MDKEQQQVHPLAPTANGHSRSDEEVAASSSAAKDLKKKKRNKCFAYIAVFTVFQIAIMLVFILVIMRLRTPKFRVRSASFRSFNSTPSVPSFNFQINAELGVRNANFGNYRYRNSTIQFFYMGELVGTGNVNRARARARSTRRFNVDVDLISNNLLRESELRSDLNLGILRLTSRARLQGRVVFFFVMRRRRSTEMDCSMDVVIATQLIRNVVCR